MPIDLTKPIEVRILRQPIAGNDIATTGCYSISHLRKGMLTGVGTRSRARDLRFDTDEEEGAYYRLFNAAPKMLAMLKEVYGVVEACHSCIQDAAGDLDARYLGLIAEIEGTALDKPEEGESDAGAFRELHNMRRIRMEKKDG